MSSNSKRYLEQEFLKGLLNTHHKIDGIMNQAKVAGSGRLQVLPFLFLLIHQRCLLQPEIRQQFDSSQPETSAHLCYWNINQAHCQTSQAVKPFLWWCIQNVEWLILD